MGMILVRGVFGDQFWNINKTVMISIRGSCNVLVVAVIIIGNSSGLTEISHHS